MRALIDGVGMDLGRGHILAYGIEVDIVVRVNDPAAELDGGYMTLTGGPEAHDESQRSLVHALLVRVRHDGRIKECRRLNRVLGRKVRAKQQTLVGRQGDFFGYEFCNTFEIPLQGVSEVSSRLYDDPRMIGHIYSAPYLKLAPELCFVAVDELGVAGFIVGAKDTLSFERLLEDAWWPVLRAAYDAPNEDSPDDWSADQRRRFMIHHPERTPAGLARTHPAHLHMNLLPRIQGRGIGPKLLKLWFDKARELGVTAVRVGANVNNTGAVRFWKKQGFKTLDGPTDLPLGRTIWLGRGA